jgi:FkbM family methyltransferase
MAKKVVTFKNLSFAVDTDGDHYGSYFWETLEKRKWEPDTIDFLEREIDSATLLIDVGAANGSICLLGACLGARVVGYEPNPTVYNVCRKNIALNQGISESILLKLAAISNVESELLFEVGSNSNVITEISVGIHSDPHTVIPVLSLEEELKTHARQNEKIIVKMDIEGAEFAILHDQSTLQSLNLHRVKLLLAIHPGFYRPIGPGKLFRKLRSRIFILRNFLEAATLFNEISKYADIYRTNLNPVKSNKIFALLVVASYHEFILDFSEDD